MKSPVDRRGHKACQCERNCEPCNNCSGLSQKDRKIFSMYNFGFLPIGIGGLEVRGWFSIYHDHVPSREPGLQIQTNPNQSKPSKPIQNQSKQIQTHPNQSKPPPGHLIQLTLNLLPNIQTTPAAKAPPLKLFRASRKLSPPTPSPTPQQTRSKLSHLDPTSREERTCNRPNRIAHEPHHAADIPKLVLSIGFPSNHPNTSAPQHAPWTKPPPSPRPGSSLAHPPR